MQGKVKGQPYDVSVLVKESAEYPKIHGENLAERIKPLEKGIP